MSIIHNSISPCIKICVLHKKYDICLGCFRKSKEISTWSIMSQKQKKEIILKLDKRKKEFKPKRRLK